MKNISKAVAVSIVVALIVGFAGFGTVPAAKPGTLRAKQLQFTRVKGGYEHTWDSICARLNRLNVSVDQLEVFLRSFKEDKILEVWVKQKSDSVWKQYGTYSVIKTSGRLGPKRCQNDHQIPEGFYAFDSESAFKPMSRFHIGLLVNYPNASDKVFACKGDPGDAIMIHGAGGSTGCTPISNLEMEEVYVLCIEARDAGQKSIPFHTFPLRFTDENVARIKTAEVDTLVHLFWDNIRPGYDWFETKKQLPKVTVDSKGKYIFN